MTKSSCSHYETAKEKWEAEQKERNLQIGDCLWKVIQYIILQ